MNTRPLTDIVPDFFRRHSLFGSSGVLALSGGPDSVCLAILLRDWQRQGHIPKLVLAHLNHQLRGPESDADELFVRSLAHEWDLPLRTESRNVALEADQIGANLEETARRLRYDWLTKIAHEEGAGWVATGHNADDQAETVLFRLLRGSGLHGLAGMAERRVLVPGLDLLRPLLTVNRAAILTFLKDRGQNYRTDSSNQDRGFTRNRLRHELLPILAEQYNPAIIGILCQLAHQVREAEEVLASLANRLLAHAELPRAGEIIILSVAGLAQAARHMQCEVFRLIWRRENWPMGQMTYEAWHRLRCLVQGEMTALDLPEGVKARRVGQVVQLKRDVITHSPQGED